MIDILLSTTFSVAIFVMGLVSAAVLVYVITRHRAVAITSFDLAVALVLVAGYLSFDLLVLLNGLENVVVPQEVLIIASRMTRAVFFGFTMYISIRGHRRQVALEREEGQWNNSNGEQ